jgi:hypothetical protein
MQPNAITRPKNVASRTHSRKFIPPFTQGYWHIKWDTHQRYWIRIDFSYYYC